jgi:hypothetical protein
MRLGRFRSATFRIGFSLNTETWFEFAGSGFTELIPMPASFPISVTVSFVFLTKLFSGWTGQARTSTRRGTRAARSSATAHQSGGQAGRSRSPKRAAARGTSSKRTQATGGKSASAEKKARERSAGSQSRSTPGRNAGKGKRAA